jgi:glycosyltransferase involved in cell wall biosynthesis
VTGPWHIAVLIPARDEQSLIARCLRSILESRLLLPPDVSTDIIVVSDSSTDNTFQIVTQMISNQHQTEGLVVESAAGCVGAARALAAQLALDRYTGALDRCWLANTDADCEVPRTWLLDHLAFAKSGVAAVAGVIDVDSFAEHDAYVPERFRLSYLIHPDGTHPHVHGANLGVRADAYLHAGGWQHLSTAEDHDLWQRLHRGQHKRVADASLRVTTSGRRIGRAPRGFADALAAHNGASV